MLALLSISGCADELPTLSGEDRFPGGAAPTTIEVFLPTAEVLAGASVFGDFTNPRDAEFLLVAHRFDEALEANTLARLTGFPDSVTFTLNGATRTEAAFTYGTGRVITRVDAAASASAGPAVLRLWALEQEWDSATVTWTQARQGTPWRTPGGTRGALLAEARWTPGDTVARDSVIWQVDSLAVRRMASPSFAGLLVTSVTPDTRLQLSRLVLQTTQRPTARPDTAVAVTVAQGPQEFIFTPEPPRPEGVYRVGGPTGDRTVLRLTLPSTVPACRDPASTPGCPRVALRDVTLNRASLVLDPVRVRGGFRPVGLTPLLVRRVLEPELGRRAPLGESIAFDSIAPGPFRGTPSEPVTLNLTQSVSQLLRSDSSSVAVALLSDPEGARFGYLWFAGTPRLRLIYTLPVRPGLP